MPFDPNSLDHEATSVLECFRTIEMMAIDQPIVLLEVGFIFISFSCLFYPFYHLDPFGVINLSSIHIWVYKDNHQIWSLKDGKSIQSWFEQAFPRMPFKKNDTMVSAMEWDRLAKASGVRFPPCQYSPGLSVTSTDGKCGVALVGDAGELCNT